MKTSGNTLDNNSLYNYNSKGVILREDDITSNYKRPGEPSFFRIT